MSDCNECEYYESETNECWFNPANPQEVTQPEVDNCDYFVEK